MKGKPKGADEVYCIVDGRKSDALIHETWMEGVEESEEYRMTSYKVAVGCGISKETASNLYLMPGDKEYITPKVK